MAKGQIKGTRGKGKKNKDLEANPSNMAQIPAALIGPSLSIPYSASSAQLYRNSSLGRALDKTVNTLLHQGKIPPTLIPKIWTHYDLLFQKGLELKAAPELKVYGELKQATLQTKEGVGHFSVGQGMLNLKTPGGVGTDKLNFGLQPIQHLEIHGSINNEVGIGGLEDQDMMDEDGGDGDDLNKGADTFINNNKDKSK